MNRKNFISSVIPLTTSFTEIAGRQTSAVIKPADPEEIMPAINKMKEWGFEIRIGETVGAKEFTFAGSDEQRASDFQSMIDDVSINAIMLARCGYGAVR